jgi:YidC/Oxa1 family membrane protein insertase
MQNNNNNENNFLDSKTIMAIVLIGIVWFGWQSYLNKKYPQTDISPKSSTPSETKDTVTVNNSLKTSSSRNSLIESNNTTGSAEKVEQLMDIDLDSFHAQLSSKGMAFKNLKLKKYLTRAGDQIAFTNGKLGIYSTLVGEQLVDFEIVKKSETQFIGVGRVGDYEIEKSYDIDQSNFKVTIKVTAKTIDNKFPGLKLVIDQDQIKSESSSFLSPPTDNQMAFVKHGENNIERPVLSNPKDVISKEFALARVVGIGTHYFASALVDKSDTAPRAFINDDFSNQNVRAQFIYNPALGNSDLVTNSIGYIGPKDISKLESADSEVISLVDFGFFASLAKPMHSILKWFFGFVGNWGVSIILLTLLVRIVILPLHIMSFKSMKAMQKIQPSIQAIREKYKDDPTTLNREMMDIMKTNKVNPLGGCLPMLMQIPVFLALYQVFGQSIEFYQAPFIFWIKDLSLKDPYFILPVLMGITMFMQQKMTPSTMDPAQAKIMMFMPIVFSFMMISLPSALTLYIFVSTLFGIIQQFMFLKDKTAPITLKVGAKA